MFMASLIYNMDVDCETLLVCRMDLDCVKILHFDTEVNSNFVEPANAFQELTLNSCTSDDSRSYFMGKSPFLALDAFVVSIATIGNVSWACMLLAMLFKAMAHQTLNSYKHICSNIFFNYFLLTFAIRQKKDVKIFPWPTVLFS